MNTIWFLLWGILWIVYFILDGFDLGLGTLMPFIAKNEEEKRIIYNAIGPFWDGNEVWLISAGGITFAAFPKTYAVMFSGLYTALMLLLVALIIRGVSFEFRGKVDSKFWKGVWDICLFVGSFLPALLLGVAFANIFKGIPIDENGVFHGNILTLLNPYGLIGGVLFVLLFLEHGALWLCIRSTGDLQIRAAVIATRIWQAKVVVFVLFLALSVFVTDLFANYFHHIYLLPILILPIYGLFLSRNAIAAQKWVKAWIGSALTIAGTTLFGLLGIYPNMLPSSIDPKYSVTIYNGSASPLTLKIMLIVALIFIPIVILYQLWVYKKFAHPITKDDLAYEEAY